MITLTIALFACFAAVGLMCYEAGADKQKRAEWQKHSDEALALVAEAGSRTRHCAGRDL